MFSSSRNTWKQTRKSAGNMDLYQASLIGALSAFAFSREHSGDSAGQEASPGSSSFKNPSWLYRTFPWLNHLGWNSAVWCLPGNFNCSYFQPEELRSRDDVFMRKVSLCFAGVCALQQGYPQLKICLDLPMFNKTEAFTQLHEELCCYLSIGVGQAKLALLAQKWLHPSPAHPSLCQ